jgi:hypothetical protein
MDEFGQWTMARTGVTGVFELIMRDYKSLVFFQESGGSLPRIIGDRDMILQIASLPSIKNIARVLGPLRKIWSAAVSYKHLFTLGMFLCFLCWHSTPLILKLSATVLTLSNQIKLACSGAMTFNNFANQILHIYVPENLLSRALLGKGTH